MRDGRVGNLALFGDGVTQDVRRQARVRIRPQLVVAGEDCLLPQVAIKRPLAPAQLLLVQTEREIIHRRLDFLPGFHGHFLFEPDIMIGDELAFVVASQSGLQPLHQFDLVLLQERCQHPSHLRLAIADKRRVGAHRFDQHACRQQIPPRIQDVATPGFEQDSVLGVLLGFGPQFLVAQHL